MDPITAYNSKASDYAAYRLPYSGDIVTTALDITGLRSACTMVDVAAGTGIVSSMFIEHVTRIIAVEPNAEMRQQADHVLDTHETFTSIAGAAEHTTLPDASADLITVGQAWHWFDPQAAAREFVRILKPDGWVAVIWNRFGNTKDPDLTCLFPAGDAKRMEFPMVAKESWEQYIGGVRSAAAAPSVNDPAYHEFEQDQRTLFDSKALEGILTVEYCTVIEAGKL